MEYPKINSLYKRTGMYWNEENKAMQYDRTKKHDLIIGDYALPEFGLIKEWMVFEKIDGTNIRITFTSEDSQSTDNTKFYKIQFDGRTKDSQLPTHLLKYLQETFTIEKLAKVFPDTQRVILFGEGYGPKIQSGGVYRDDVSFILFDVFVAGEWWLEYEDRLDIASKLGIDHVPYLCKMTEHAIATYVKAQPKSKIAKDLKYVMEGVVCSTEPILRLRNGNCLKFKLRCEDMK